METMEDKENLENILNMRSKEIETN